MRVKNLTGMSKIEKRIVAANGFYISHFAVGDCGIDKNYLLDLKYRQRQPYL
jgi:hypothetical protein